MVEHRKTFPYAFPEWTARFSRRVPASVFGAARPLRKLGILAVLVLFSGCKSCPTSPLSGPPPGTVVVHSAEPIPDRESRLKVLTWNVWLMPKVAFQSPRNRQRASVIAEDLLKLDFDILCLEKVFDQGARKVLSRAFADRYPYQYGPANSKCSLKVNSGVWIASRLPLADYHEIQFRESAGVERLSRKGALLLTGAFEGQRFHILATHLQGESGPRYTAERQKVRERQLLQIREELLTPYTDPALPLIVCGDLNIPRHELSGVSIEALAGAQCNSDELVTLEDDCSRNDLAISNGGRSQQLDYILIRPGAVKVVCQWDRLIFLHPGWDGSTTRQNLSYRHALAAYLTFPAVPAGP